MRAVGEANRSACAADFLHRDDVGKITQVDAAVFLFDCDAEHPELTETAPKVAGEIVAAIDLGSARCDFLAGKLGNRCAQGVHGCAEAEIETGRTHGLLRLRKWNSLDWVRHRSLLLAFRQCLKRPPVACRRVDSR